MLGRDAKIPHSSFQRRAFVHGPASGEFRAAFGDADAGRRDPDRRLQLFRHAGQVLRRRSLGVLPNAGDLRLSSARAAISSASSRPNPSLKRSVSTSGVVANICLTPARASSTRSMMAPSAIPTASAPCDSTTISANLPKMGSGANEAPNGNSKKFSSGTNKSVNATWWLPVPLRPNACHVSRISQMFGRHETGADHRAGSVRGVDGRTVLHHHAGAPDPLGVLAPAGKRPCAGNPPSAGNALGRADRLTRGNDVILSVLEKFLTQARARQERRQGPDMADHGIPAHRPVEPGQGRDCPKGARRVKFKPAVTPGYEHAVNPCRFESGHELRWQPPTLLDLQAGNEKAAACGWRNTVRFQFTGDSLQT